MKTKTFELLTIAFNLRDEIICEYVVKCPDTGPMSINITVLNLFNTCYRQQPNDRRFVIKVYEPETRTLHRVIKIGPWFE